jgi:hypothetical protein
MSSTCAAGCCDDLNCPLRPVVALAEVCKGKTLISFAVGAPVEIAQPFGLQAIGDDSVEQLARQVAGRLTSEDGLPSCPQPREVEIGQMRDLIIQLVQGRGHDDQAARRVDFAFTGCCASGDTIR